MWQLSDQAGKAIAAAQAAIWEWQAGPERFILEGQEGGTIHHLSGAWTLEDFARELDGLSRKRLPALLEVGRTGTLIDTQISLANGELIRLVGAFESDDLARGLCLMAAEVTPLALADRIEAVFQPIVALQPDGQPRLVGVEALARWRDGEGRILSADRLPAGEKNFTSDRLAEIMLTKSAQALSDLQRSLGNSRLAMQVNVSSADVFRDHLRDLASTLVQRHSLPPSTLRIELTEQTALRNFDAGLQALAGFRKAGLGLVLDDFGSGHSSFHWLARIEADGLKIDGDLVNAPVTARRDAIIQAMTGLAGSLSMSVTAEGVEDDGTGRAMVALGCDYLQGFVFARPMELHDLKTWVKARHALPESD